MRRASCCEHPSCWYYCGHTLPGRHPAAHALDWKHTKTDPVKAGPSVSPRALAAISLFVVLMILTVGHCCSVVASPPLGSCFSLKPARATRLSPRRYSDPGCVKPSAEKRTRQACVSSSPDPAREKNGFFKRIYSGRLDIYWWCTVSCVDGHRFVARARVQFTTDPRPLHPFGFPSTNPAYFPPTTCRRSATQN